MMLMCLHLCELWWSSVMSSSPTACQRNFGVCRPGATEAQLDEAEEALGVRLPLSVRALYRIHDGQHLPADAAADTTGECRLDVPSTLHGMFGGCA